MADNQPTLFDSEIWKPVAGYEEFYSVSNLGQVRSHDRIDSLGRMRKGQPLTPTRYSTGYFFVSLFRDGKKMNQSIHRLVADAHIGPRPEGMQVDHIDNNTANNRRDNLQYVTPRENTRRQKLFGTSASDRVANGTHNQTSKTNCPRGHKLVGENLIPSKLKIDRRECLACERARGYIRNHPGLKTMFQEISDSYYGDIMASPPRPA